jgi:hypothetical protein
MKKRKTGHLLNGTLRTLLWQKVAFFSSMAECRNALVTYCMKVERAFVVDKSDKRRYTVHCVSEDCQWRMHASKMLAAPMFR